MSIGTLFEEIRLNGGSVDKPTSQRQTRLGVGRGVSQAKEQRFTPNFQDSVSIRYLVEI